MTDPDALSRPARASRAPAVRSRRVPLPAVMVVGLVAFLVRLGLVLHGGGLDGSYGYDNGVYFSAATALVWGRMPYADFVLLHPPGIVLALTPFAALGRLTRDSLGFEAARVAWMLLGAVNAMLVVRVARRWGTAAAVAGGLFYALWPPAAQTEMQTRLEPLVSLGVLVALVVLLRPRSAITSRSLLIAGAALGCASSVKIWAVVPLVVLLAWSARRLGVRACVWLVTGVAAAAVVVCLPFFANAPTAMFRMVVRDQTGRGRSSLTSWERLGSMFGFVPVPTGVRVTPLTIALGIAVLALVVVAALSRQGGSGLVVGLLAVESALLLVAPSYFTFYAAFLAPALALAVGCGAGALVMSRGRTRLRAVLAPVAAVALLGVLAALAYVDRTTTVGVAVPTSRLQEQVAGRQCVTADAPEGLLLADALSPDLAHGCALMVDVTGLTHDRDAPALRPDGTPTPPGANAAWQRDLSSYLLSGRRILLSRPLDVVIGPALRRELAARSVLVSSDAYVLLGPPRR